MRHPLFSPRDMLMDEVRLPQISLISTIPARNEVAFITGATGFIGGYILLELLENRVFKKIYCLVRGETKEIRKMKLKQSIAQKGGQYEDVADRLEVVPGDIFLPRFGLPGHTYDRLCEEVDQIFHFAGSMNWVKGFGPEARMNIQALREVIALTARHRTKILHYASSMGAWSILDPEPDPILENKLHDHPERLPGGYCQLKWINEKICELARSQGLPILTYRIGDVKGHSVTGHSDPANFGNLMMQHMLETGKVPTGTTRFNFLPVDYVVQIVARIAQNPTALPGQTFQFNNPESIGWADFANALRTIGIPPKQVPFAEWWASLDQKTITCRALRAVFRPFTPHQGSPPVSFFDIGTSLYLRPHNDYSTQNALKGSGISCPRMLSDKVLLRYLTKGL